MPVRGGRASLACSRDETSHRRGGARRPRLLLSGCGRAPEPVDLLGAGDRLVEASAAGAGREAVLEAVAARPAPERRRPPRLPRRPARPPALRARHPEGRAASARLRDRPALPRAARGRVRGEGEDGTAARTSSGPGSSTRSPGPRTAPGSRWTWTSRSRRAGARAGARDARLRAGGRPGARLVGHARDHRRPQGAPRDRLPRGHAAGRPHRRLRLRAEHDPRARRLREGRRRLRRGDRARLVDEAVGGLDPHLEAPGAAQGRAAARPARPFERHDCPASRRSGVGRPAPPSPTR